MNCSIDNFYFTTAFHGDNLRQWSERVALLKEWRRIVDENGTQFEASVYHEEGIYLDLVNSVNNYV
jgi:hypothetical protein